ncbi:hypothetical protein PV797_07970 [Clostridiaceae bacterium M8S5]|nr:hypothetical protein PV797_07970 [Clostridiaceae bacterium M8S5]
MRHKNILKYILIIMISIMFAMLLHIITSNFSTTPKNPEWSIIVQNIGLTATLILWYIIAFGSIALVYSMFRSSVSGVRYGLGIGILWLWGMLEGVSLSGNPYINEFITGLSDALPIILMGLLLGRFIPNSENKKLRKEPILLRNKIISLVSFSLVFLVGRSIFYYTGVMTCGYKQYPYFTVIWTFIMGTCIGIAYILIGQTMKRKSILHNAIKFGVIVFGVNWTVFVIFMPFVFRGKVVASIIRILVDVGLIICSCYLSERLSKKRKYKILT